MPYNKNIIKFSDLSVLELELLIVIKIVNQCGSDEEGAFRPAAVQALCDAVRHVKLPSLRMSKAV